jgi:uncharacterized phage-associated protein
MFQFSTNALYREDKALAVASIFLVRAGGSMSYLKLIKLMYLVERRSLIERGLPITFDRLYSLDLGPIVSDTKNRIDYGPDVSETWAKCVQTIRYDAVLGSDCDRTVLSEYEAGVVTAVFDEFGGWDPFELCDFLHDTLPEWTDPEGSAIKIGYREILLHGGWSEHQAAQALDSLRQHFYAESLLQ